MHHSPSSDGPIEAELELGVCREAALPSEAVANRPLHYQLWTACYNDARWLGKATLRETGQTGKPVYEAEPGGGC